MKKYILLLLLSFLLVSNKSHAQAALGIGQHSYYIGNDTLSAYSTDSVVVWVINRGSATFSGNLELYTSVQDSSFLSYHLVDTANAGSVTIAAGDSIAIALSPYYDVSPAAYHYDINVIVIWPVSLSAPTEDSLMYLQVLTVASGVNEIDLKALIQAYPNPVQTDIAIRNTGETGIEEVRMYDSQGRLITLVKKQDIIHTDDWNPGIYLMKIVLENKQSLTIRIVKQ